MLVFEAIQRITNAMDLVFIDFCVGECQISCCILGSLFFVSLSLFLCTLRAAGSLL